MLLLTAMLLVDLAGDFVAKPLGLRQYFIEVFEHRMEPLGGKRLSFIGHERWDTVRQPKYRRKAHHCR
jgi:hypothetical protein